MSVGASTWDAGVSGLLEDNSTALVSPEARPTYLPLHLPWKEEPRASGVIVGDAERARTFEESISAICSYRDLTENWDTYGGVRASEKSIEFSVRLLENLQVQPEMSPPHVSPISTGVYIEWRVGDHLLYFEVDEDSVLFAWEEGGSLQQDGEDPSFDVTRALEIVKRLHGVGDLSNEEITQYSILAG